MTPQEITRDRYRVEWSGLAQAYKIVDDAMGGISCGLPDGEGRFPHLAFRRFGDAKAWLACAADLGLPMTYTAGDWSLEAAG